MNAGESLSPDVCLRGVHRRGFTFFCGLTGPWKGDSARLRHVGARAGGLASPRAAAAQGNA